MCLREGVSLPQRNEKAEKGVIFMTDIVLNKIFICFCFWKCSHCKNRGHWLIVWHRRFWSKVWPCVRRVLVFVTETCDYIEWCHCLKILWVSMCPCRVSMSKKFINVDVFNCVCIRHWHIVLHWIMPLSKKFINVFASCSCYIAD